MKKVSIELLKDHSIRGKEVKKGVTCEGIHEGVADDLVKRGIAKIVADKKTK